MLRLSAIVALVGLSGCGWAAEIGAHATGYSRSCVEGVSYLQFPSGVTVEYQADGHVKSCR